MSSLFAEDDQRIRAVTSQECVTFKANENIYKIGQKRYRELAIKKGKRVNMVLDTERQFQSYVNEYCGKYNISDLTFTVDSGTKLIMHKSPKQKTLINVSQNKSNSETFINSMPFSDIMIKINGETEIKAHRCILVSRSPKFKAMLLS